MEEASIGVGQQSGTYRGRRGGLVSYEEESAGRLQVSPLVPRTDLADYGPVGFNWGFAGEGSAQLALALAAHATGDDARAMNVYQSLKWTWVSRLEGSWSITKRELLERIAALEAPASAPKVCASRLHPDHEPILEARVCRRCGRTYCLRCAPVDAARPECSECQREMDLPDFDPDDLRAADD